jgi:hypothetical protein
MIKIYSDSFYNLDGVLIVKKNINWLDCEFSTLDTNFNKINDYFGGNIINIIFAEWRFGENYQIIIIHGNYFVMNYGSLYEQENGMAHMIFMKSEESINEIINKCKIDAKQYEFIYLSNFIYKIPINIKICWSHLDLNMQNIILQKHRIMNNVFMKDTVVFVFKLLLELFRLNINDYREKQ